MKRLLLVGSIAASLLITACTEPQFDLALVATVGTDPDVCATESDIELFDGRSHTVYYCYTITNTGGAVVRVHDLVDELSGQVLRDFEYPLLPGESVDTVAAGVTIAVDLEADASNTGTWDGYLRGVRAATAEATATVTFVPPRQYGVVAGTFVAASNVDTVPGLDGNLLVLGALDLAGDPVSESFDITVTPPGAESFVVTYDPATAPDGVMALIVEDFDPGVASVALPGLRAEATVATVARSATAIGTSAALSGEFVIEFPGQTIVRSVDATAKLTAPEVTSTVYDDAAFEVEVQFVEAAALGVDYAVEAYGTGFDAYTGFASGTGSPIVVQLALGVGEGLGVHVVATRGALDPFGDVGQVDLAEYLFVSTVED